jgi:hypothetical protein
MFIDETQINFNWYTVELASRPSQPGRRAVPEECRFHSVPGPCTALYWDKGRCDKHVSTDSFRTDGQNISVTLQNSLVLFVIFKFKLSFAFLLD